MERKIVSEKRLEELFGEVVRELRTLGIPISRKITGPVINRRAKARFGCCKAERKFPGQVTYIIEVSERALAAQEKNIKEIIAHELLHTCKDCMNHGKKWKEYAAVVKSNLGYDITRTTSYESLGIEPPEQKAKIKVYRYELICQNCGGRILRQKRCRLTENPHLYRCGKCGGTLKLQTKNTTSCR